MLDVLSFHFNGSKGTCTVVGELPPLLKPFLLEWADENEIHLLQCTKGTFKNVDFLYGDVAIIIFGSNALLLKKSLELDVRSYIIKGEHYE